MTTEIVPVVCKSFLVYIAMCLLLDQIRKKHPETVVQSGKHPLQETQKTECIKTAMVNLSIGAMLLFLVGKWIQITKTGNTLFFFETIKLLIMFFVSDTMFYWSHRLLHIPAIFKIAHKQHHSHNEPISWTSLFVHPIEFLVALVGIFLVPLLIFSLHPITATVFLIGIMVSLAFSHSGLKWGFINSTHHDLHHQRRKGNYGSDIGIWDKICGTQI